MDHTERDGPDTPLANPERGEEVELTARLIVAANESAVTLSQEQIDTILGVSPGA